MQKAKRLSRIISGRLLKTRVLTGAIFTFLILFAGFSFLLWQNQRRIIIPSWAAQQVLFPLYSPQRLPKGYAIQPDSYQVKDGALIFAARNAAGHVLSITEQARPQSFDFTNFYQTHLQNAKSMDKAPYPTVVGVLPDTNTRIASITSTDTWILVSTPVASGSSSDLELVATSLKPQQ